MMWGRTDIRSKIMSFDKIDKLVEGMFFFRPGAVSNTPSRLLKSVVLSLVLVMKQ